MNYHVPRKRFGQHFLTDRNIVAKIVAAIHPSSQDLMVEIGPGPGALTRPLLEILPQLHVVEIDRDIVQKLNQEFVPERLTVHCADALRFDFASLGKNLRVAGNLPYNISTPLLFHLCEFASAIKDLHFMLQKEVVERMVAKPSTPEYGRLGVMLQYRFQMEKLFTVPASAFHPAPKVESAFVRMLPITRPKPKAKDEGLFEKIVRTAFSQRRKMLRNTLKPYLAPEGIVKLGIDPNARAENLSVADFVKITNSLG